MCTDFHHTLNTLLHYHVKCKFSKNDTKCAEITIKLYHVKFKHRFNQSHNLLNIFRWTAQCIQAHTWMCHSFFIFQQDNSLPHRPLDTLWFLKHEVDTCGIINSVSNVYELKQFLLVEEHIDSAVSNDWCISQGSVATLLTCGKNLRIFIYV